MNEKNFQNKRENVNSRDFRHVYFDNIYLRIFDFHFEINFFYKNIIQCYRNISFCYHNIFVVIKIKRMHHFQ